MITEDLMNECYEEIEAMTEEQRLALDPISQALESYKCAYQDNAAIGPGILLPNRIVALLAVKIMEAHDKIIWERD